MKDGKKMDTHKKRSQKGARQKHFDVIYPISNTYLDVKETSMRHNGPCKGVNGTGRNGMHTCKRNDTHKGLKAVGKRKSEL